MSPYLTSTLLVLALLVAAAYAWYNNPGAWEPITIHGGDDAYIGASGAHLNQLRFKNMVFTTANPSGRTESWDVTGVLNGMATAFDVDMDSPPPHLDLTGGGSDTTLNPFTFVKPGFNDRATVSDPTAWASVPASSTSLVGKMRILG